MKLWITVLLAVAVPLCGCDKLRGSGNRELAALAAPLPGTEACQIEDKLDGSTVLKAEFVRLFGETNWIKWKAYKPPDIPLI